MNNDYDILIIEYENVDNDSNVRYDNSKVKIEYCTDNKKIVECCINNSSEEVSVIETDSNDFENKTNVFVIDDEYRVDVEFQEVADINVRGSNKINTWGKLTGCDMIEMERSDMVNISINKGNHNFSNEDKFITYCLFIILFILIMDEELTKADNLVY